MLSINDVLVDFRMQHWRKRMTKKRAAYEQRLHQAPMNHTLLMQVRFFA